MEEKALNECGCPECERREEQAKDHEEMSFALLLSIVPLMVLTLFGQIGAF